MKNRTVLLIAAVAFAGVLAVSAAQKQLEKAQFSRTTIDLGVVVSDVDKAVKFYTEALGFTKVGEFDVSGQMAGDTGLTDSQPFKVHVFALGDDPSATKLKIMSIAGSKPVANQYIGSSLGFRYLTVFVADLNKALARLQQNGVSPVKPAYSLGGDSHLILVKDPDGNTIELIGPRP
ncbi:MAG: VOC family protein [Phycisphaerae bacterium]|nr:VOC family protein [Phycisphaerae bacterium]